MFLYVRVTRHEIQSVGKKSIQSTDSNEVSKQGRMKQRIKGATEGSKGATGRAQIKDAGVARLPLQNNHHAIQHHSNTSCNNCGRFHVKRN